MTTPTTPTTKHAEQRPDNTKPAQTMQQKPQGTTVVQQQKPAEQKPDQKPAQPVQPSDPNRARENQYGVDPKVNTKPQDQGGGDQDPHPSPITDPTNALPEPLMFDEDNPRPKLARPGELGYVAGQPVSQEEYDLTEKEAAEKVRPEAWERGRQQKANQREQWGDRSESRQSDEDSREGDHRSMGTRPDGRPLRDPTAQDDDANKAPGGAGGQGTRADGRARAPDMPGEGPNDRGEGVDKDRR